MQLISIFFLASVALGGVIPVARDTRIALAAASIINRRGATVDQVLKPENFAHVQEDRRKAQRSWEEGLLASI
ncbi:hypothetical protein F4677DRAFT_446405 [Hypoxylon crocopeplum]|nr:hypothetical protein F4677DRAFT_446405 [Hypoxylon crocopeplum]